MRNLRCFAIVLALAGCGDNTSTEMDGGGPPDMAMPDLTPRPPQRLVILHTNDEHSHLFAWAPELDDDPKATQPGTGALVGGVARRATVLKQERDAAKAAGADVLTLSAGDNVMGTLTQVGFAATAPDFTLMKALGYDATCLGNHEFDYGPKTLAAALKAAKAQDGLIPTLSTNIHFDPNDPRDDDLAAGYSATPDPKALVEKYHILTTASGLRVGLIGIVGADASYDETPKAPVTFSLGPSMKETNYAEVLQAIYADVQPTVDQLRNVEKVDLVIALDHASASLSDPSSGEDWQIAENVPGIDIIISGHSHTAVPSPQLPKNKKTGRTVPVVQAGAFGAYVGRLDVTLQSDGTVTVDTNNSKLIKVDDTVLPDLGMVQMATDRAVHDLESTPWMNTGKSFLEGTLSRIVGAPVADDPNTNGDLYFYPLGKADYDIDQFSFHETDLLDLSTDAMLAAGDKYNTAQGEKNQLSVQAAGVIRGSLPKGKTGTLDMADLFRVLALGSSPVDGSIGYPLVHVYLFLVEIKAAFELVAAIGLTADSQYLTTSGLRVTFDTSRKVFDTGGSPLDPQNGRVTKIEWNSNHAQNGYDSYDVVLFDVTRTGAEWDSSAGGKLTKYGVITNSYIASFAASAGVALKNANGLPIQSLGDAIIRRPDGSEVKDFEALAEFVRDQSMKNGGTLPANYNAADPAGMIPRRMVCLGPSCPK